MPQLYVNDETAHLETVILGIATSMGGVPSMEEAYDPKSKTHIQAGTFPKEAAVATEIEGFKAVLEKHGVKVLRPEVFEDTNQVFARDIGMVIEDKFIVPNIIEKRSAEVEAIQYLVETLPKHQVVHAPENVRVEGGDVMPWKDHLFVGYSEEEDFEKYEVARTNAAALSFLQAQFPNKKVIGFELRKSDSDPRENALHLDCCFQPIGHNQAILYPGGFKNKTGYDFLLDFFGRENTIAIDREEMYQMQSNVFSISPDILVSENNFTRLNQVLREKGFTVETIAYSETAKMEGLLRCSTMPLKRRKA